MSTEREVSLSARRILPSNTLPEDRLQLPAAPCVACGADVDPLRTPSVLAFEDGVRLLCSEQCKTDYRAGARARRRPQQLNATPSAGVTRVTPLTASVLASQPRIEPGLPPQTVRWLFLGMVTVLLSGVLACFNGPEVALFSAVCAALGAAVAMRLTIASFSEIGVFAWVCGPLGVFGAALAGYRHSEGTPGDLAQLGAAFTSLALLCRAFFDARARQPVDSAAAFLRAHLKGRTASGLATPLTPLRTSIDSDSAASDAEPDKVRIGDELIVRRGDRVAVDSVVQVGEARVLPFPTATTSIPRGPGDTLLAGATLVEGGVRVVATRIGEDRSLSRALRGGQVHPQEGAPLVRLSSELSRYGGLLSLIVALGLLMWGDSEGRVLPLAAASALLLASPWLALRRAAEWPFTAAATTAAARGVLFQNGAALELAGNVDVVAMTPHRTLTEGSPEVVEVHMLGESSPPNAADDLLGLVAAAELVATEDAVGRAIVSYAETRRVQFAEVRRSVLTHGHGVTALGPTGEEVVIGSRRLLLDHGVSVALAESHAARAEALGRTAVFVSVAGRVRAVIALYDQLRAGARSAVQRMFDMNVEVALLTGGQRGPVEQLAARLEITHIKAELSSEERGQEVRSLREAGSKVAVIGYPSDDNPALSAADVGVALGAAGGPAGDRAIALVGEDVRDAAAALWIARAARQGALNSARIALVAFVCVVTAAVSGVLEPAVAALISLAIDAHCIHTGARLLRRIALRIPTGS
ncbi:MAG TPA: HAD family hydrolase [Polyangiales bacterium]|nr:HAD family hydrolase [Polyangiales bacterium]